jgi:hypothetical protein
LSEVSDLELHLNKLSNTLRFIGLLVSTMAVGVFIGLSSSGLEGERALVLFLSAMGTAGLCAISFGEMGWRLILKHGVSEQRFFYFFNSDRKKFE